MIEHWKLSFLVRASRLWPLFRLLEAKYLEDSLNKHLRFRNWKSSVKSISFLLSDWIFKRRLIANLNVFSRKNAWKKQCTAITNAFNHSKMCFTWCPRAKAGLHATPQIHTRSKTLRGNLRRPWIKSKEKWILIFKNSKFSSLTDLNIDTYFNYNFVFLAIYIILIF